jgi:hypothetical protein
MWQRGNDTCLARTIIGNGLSRVPPHAIVVGEEVIGTGQHPHLYKKSNVTLVILKKLSKMFF